MKIKHPLVAKGGGFLASALIRNWMSKLDYKMVLYNPTLDPSFPECDGKKIYIFWHEYILYPIYLYGRCNLVMLLSQHGDAEILSYAAGHLGFDAVRGSTNRGGIAALRQLLKKGRQMHLTITPDGPRGPRRTMSLGTVYLASRVGLPLVPVGFGYDRPWRFGSWDRFAVPRPFSRARHVIGPEIHVPKRLDRDGLEHFRKRVEELLNHVTGEAERWAEARVRKEGQVPKTRSPAPRRSQQGVLPETKAGTPQAAACPAPAGEQPALL